MDETGGENDSPTKMDVDINETSNLSNEGYLVLRAKNALKYDSYEAKSWMLTAQTLFPHNFGVQVLCVMTENSLYIFMLY